MASYKLYGQAGSGSMIVEAAFAIADVAVECVDVAWADLGWDSQPLGKLNPLGQLPTLILPDGRTMTETAAIVLHLADHYPAAGLAPAADDPDRDPFLRWLVFLVAAVYPTFTYGDEPERWVEGDFASAGRLLRGTDQHRERLYAHLETIAGGTWFLGERFSAIDLYLWIMRYWRPGMQWFERECPRLTSIGNRAAELPAVAAVRRRNFPDG
ncbi:MAG: glutathione S-transferase family protein [Gammaproteobacteria bacterium]|nr:glutathione S-transferase family protein [Gammaproteobacteria bacterium]